MTEPAPPAHPDRVVNDPRALLALAHPLRLRILRHLDLNGPANSTLLAEALDESTGAISYHLRQLERFGFVEDLPERAVGRERWWQWTGGKQRRDVLIPGFDALTPEARAAVDRLDGLRFSEDLPLIQRFMTQFRELGDWAKGDRATLRLTQAELADFHSEYRDLVSRYDVRRFTDEEDARRIELRFFSLPADSGNPGPNSDQTL
jgi:DNA-binding transcriptional ArsR family regulator